MKLAELKYIGAVQGWYPKSGTCARRKRGVERRGDRLSDEYRMPLATLDIRYHGTPIGQVGLLVRRLDIGELWPALGVGNGLFSGGQSGYPLPTVS